MTVPAVSAAVLALGLGLPGSAWRQSEPVAVTFKAADGHTINGRLYAGAAGGPGVLLFPMCDGRGPAAWDPLGKALAAAGHTALAVEYRNGGKPATGAQMSLPDALAFWKKDWSQDAEAALAYLQTRPGVKGAPVGAAGASCGVAVSLNLAVGQPRIDRLALLGGPYDPDVLTRVGSRQDLRIYATAERGDGRATVWMRDVAAASKNAASRFVEASAAGHGTQLLERDPQLVDTIVRFFAGGSGQR